MATAVQVRSAQNTAAKPDYPAALGISGAGWHSTLAHQGVVPLVKPEIYLGRMADNDVILGDPQASRYHAVIRWAATGYEIEDLGSANGTRVDGQTISNPTALTPGRRIQIGGTSLLFQAVQLVDAADLNPSANPSGRPAPVASAVPTQRMEAPGGPAPSGSGTADQAEDPGSAIQPGTMTSLSLAAVTRVSQQAQASRLKRWLRAQLPRTYWRIFVILLVAYIAATQTLSSSDNLHLAPMVTLLGGAIVPITFVVYCWEQGAVVDISPGVLGTAFFSGAIMAALLVVNLEPNVSLHTFIGPWIVALFEETAKVVAVAWFLRNPHLRGELDGLVLGAAAGMGFATLETAGYGFEAFVNGFIAPLSGTGSSSVTLGQMISLGIQNMIDTLNQRIELAAFGHGVWTAIICAAIWRERGAATFRLTAGVVLAFAIAVTLHALWDSNNVTFVDYRLPYLLLGVIGLLVLRFFIQESLAVARQGNAAGTAQQPLPQALRAYLAGLFQSVPRAAIPVQAFTTAAAWAAQVQNSVRVGVAAAGAAAPAPVDATPEATRSCANCGAVITRQANFCGHCGKPLASA